MASHSLPFLSAFTMPANSRSSRNVLRLFPSTPLRLRSSSPSPIVLCAAAKSKQSAAAAAAAAGADKAERPARGITKPRPVSAEMQELVGVAEIPRTQALKQIWAYIKKHNLQDFATRASGFPFELFTWLENPLSSENHCDPENKKIIVCDQMLKKIFGGRERVGFLEISGLINPHFLK